jgi:tellurium resistance protein TerD
MGGQKGFGGGRALAYTVLAGPVGLFAGLIGSKKVMISCLKCGHKWEAARPN